jgi:UDP-GlcNAc:undecaprenyl-phosphate GlcNAc-1-phosphate transferase
VIAAFAVAAVVALVATPAAMRLARRWDVLDRPGPLKPHAVPVPYLGGLAVVVGTVAGAAVGGDVAAARALLPVLAALALGLADDVAVLGVASRLAGQVVVGAGVAWAVDVGPTGAGLAVVATTVVLVNAWNFLDGVDGLAGGVAVVAGIGFAVLLAAPYDRLALATGGAALAFLVFNRPPARVYLGDAGSYALGTTFSLLAATRVVGDPGLLRVLTVVALVALPLVELGTTVVRRAARRLPLAAGDRDHLYDRLVQRGLPVPAVTAMLVTVQAAVVAVAVGTTGWGVLPVALALVVLVAASLVLALSPAGG